MKYRNLVFDVGGVLLDYRWKDMLRVDRGMSEERGIEFGTRIFLDPLWKQLDLENLSYDEVVEQYVARYPEDEEDIRWFFSHIELMPTPRPDIWEMVHQCKLAGYRIYLLSNYSSYMFSVHAKAAGATFFRDLDGQMFSYEIHEIKPDAPIYQALFRKYDLKPEECLFFDDREENVEGSRACGMDAIQILSEAQLAEELQKLLP